MYNLDHSRITCWKWPRNLIFGAILLIFRLFFRVSGGSQTYVFPFFFPIWGRRPKTYSIADQRYLKTRAQPRVAFGLLLVTWKSAKTLELVAHSIVTV